MSLSNLATGLRPGVCTSTTRPSSPYTGQIIYETDTGYLRVWDGAAWDYLAQSQDGTTNLKASDVGVWTSYTPTWTNLTVGNGTNSFRYVRIGDTGFIQGEFTLGSTSSVSTNAYFSLPSGWTMPNQPISSFCNYLDTGVADWYGWLNRWNDSNLLLINGLVNGTYTQGTGTSSTVPFTWGSGDVIKVGAVVRLS